MIIPIHCQICEERIAMADPKDLSVPLHGNMFVSPYPERMPEPILQPTEWEFLRCPFCQTRPFIRNDEVLTENGVIIRIPLPSKDKNRPESEISGDQIQPIGADTAIYPCNCCNPPKKCTSLAGLRSHERAVRRKLSKK